LTRRLSNWIESYLDYSATSEAPEAFHFWTAVSTLAGALRRRVWIDMAYFQWTPNMYIILVAPPGIVSKSTTISIGMKLLREIDDVVFGPDAVTWQALTEALAESSREVLIGPDFHAMSCITIASSEFGTFLNPHDREMVDVMVSLWDGQLGVWEKRTKTQGSDSILNPWINMIACTTPSWIAGNFPEYMVGGGFTSRCVLVYAEEKRHLVAYPGAHTPANFLQLKTDLIHDLEIISQLSGEYKLSPQALQWGEEWYESHYARTKEGRFDQAKFGGYMARKQTHIHKLAIIIAAAQRNELIIHPEDLAQANLHVSALEETMPKVFSLIGRSAEARISDDVYRVVKEHKAIDKPALFQALRATYGAEEIERGLRGCLEANLVTLVQKAGRHIIVDEDFRLKQTAQAQREGSSHSTSG
jgi:hypothetical protein